MAQESPNSNSANQNSTNKMLSTLLVKNAKPPIEVVLEYYSQKKKKIEEELIGDENDPVKIATQFSLLALAQTRSLLPIGRGNVYEDIISSGGVSHMNSAFIRYTLLYVMRKEDSAVNVQAARNFRYIVQQNLKLEKNEENTMVRDLIGLQVRTHLALRYQSGRCNEYAYVALQCLYMMRNKLGDNFEKVVKDMRVVVSGDPENHVFVEMDIKEGNNKTTTIVCDPWAGYAGKLEDIPEQFNVCGRPAKEIYQSQNKTDLLNNDFIEFAFKHQSSFDNNVTNFNLYHGSVYKNNDKQPYCKYLKSLPDEPSIDYQEAMGYKSELFTDPEDYKDSSQRVYKALDSLDFKNDVPPAMKVNKGIYYSQPDLQGLSLEPVNKSINNDMDDMVLSNASNQTMHKDDNQNAKKDVNQAIQNDSSQELKQNSSDNNNNESTAQSSPLFSNSSQ